MLQVEVLGPVGALLRAVASEPVGALELEVVAVGQEVVALGQERVSI